tara:strand:+ start:265 stop:456 length:192 start_codon:yes stop_codon:yes gene_type:complete
MKKIDSIQLTELQTKRTIRIVNSLLLYYQLHVEGSETKEELKVIEQSYNLRSLLKKKLDKIKN